MDSEQNQPNPYPLSVPSEVHQETVDNLGEGDLIKIGANLKRAQCLQDTQVVRTFWQENRGWLKNSLEQLTQLIRHAPPKVIFIITTDAAKLTIDPETGLTFVASCDIDSKTVYLHPYFFTLPEAKQLEILYHELISHIYKGIRDEAEAMGDTEVSKKGVNLSYPGFDGH